MNGICAQASDDHMSLSINKCALLQVSFGRDPPPPLDITTNGQHVANVTSMTLMGITLHRSLKWDAHVLGMITKANTRKYFLVTLICAGTTTRHLLKFYITFSRPGLEYDAPMWHPGITQTLSDNIERVQRASRHIVFPELSYEQALNKTDLLALHARWRQLCLRFARSL